MAERDYNKLAHDFLRVLRTHDDNTLPQLQAVFETLQDEKEHELFDAAVGQIIKAEEFLDVEEMQELGQEIYSYHEQHPEDPAYFVPGLLLISLSGAELNTTLNFWRLEEESSR